MQASLLTQMASRPSSVQEYFAHWDNWAQAGGCTEAAGRMKQWLHANDPAIPLDLNCLNLTSLPEHLPAALRSLNVRSNQLTSLPEHLPATLQSLDASYNQLTSLPAHLPAALQSLYASENQLTSLPAHLPAALLDLCVSDNELTSLPVLPATLQTLDVAENQLTSLPAHLPATLQSLEASDNPLTSLPEHILALPNTCEICITARHLSEAVRNRLEAAMNAPGYDNARIHFDMGNEDSVQLRPLQEEVLAWAQEAGRQDLVDWSAFLSEPHATQFAQFLGRLRETSEYLNIDTQANFQQRVGNLLHQLQDDQELRGACFNLAMDAVDTCGDRIALRMLHMESVCLDRHMEKEINAGKFDANPQAVVDYCKAQYRMQRLADAAEAKIKTLNFCDETEVMLGFIVAFSQEFELTAQMDKLLYAHCSNISPEDVYETRKELTDQAFTEETKKSYRPFFEEFTHGDPIPIERLNRLPDYRKPPSEAQQSSDSFAEFLANSPAMMALLKRKHPAEITSLQARIEKKIAEEKTSLQEQVAGQYFSPQQWKDLEKQFNKIPDQVNVQMKQAALAGFCSENRLNALLG